MLCFAPLPCLSYTFVAPNVALPTPLPPQYVAQIYCGRYCNRHSFSTCFPPKVPKGGLSQINISLTIPQLEQLELSKNAEAAVFGIRCSKFFFLLKSQKNVRTVHVHIIRRISCLWCRPCDRSYFSTFFSFSNPDFFYKAHDVASNAACCTRHSPINMFSLESPKNATSKTVDEAANHIYLRAFVVENNVACRGFVSVRRDVVDFKP